MSSKISGICHICGKETELTFEHLPPRKANNNNRAKAIEIYNRIYILMKI